MRIRRHLSVVAPLVLLLGGLAAPTSVAASDPDGNPYTGNLAGKPIIGIADNTGLDGLHETACLGLAYASINNKMALLTASHCQLKDAAGNPVVGAYVRGPNGSKIGYWGSNYGVAGQGGTKDHDLAIIWLYQGNWPASRNQIYRGEVPGDNYWTITRNPTAAIGCSALGDEIPWGRDVYQNYQHAVGDNTPYKTGNMTGWFNNVPPDSKGHCVVSTDIQFHGFCCIDSGSPFVMSGYTNTLFGVASGKYSVDGGQHYYLYVTPLYKGLDLLNAYWVNVGNHVGAWLCQTATCGGIGGA